MGYENRIYLNWDEAAHELGMDREGLRQALLYRLSPDEKTPIGRDWLPVTLCVPPDGFMTTLEYGSWHRKPDLYWSGRDTFYRNCEGKGELTFSDGQVMPLEGEAGKDRWAANHGYGCGWGHTFELSGDTLTLSPESVRKACQADGRIRGLGLAPRAWCGDGFPSDLFFIVVSCENTLYAEQPGNLFESARFLRTDVLALTGDGGTAGLVPESQSSSELATRTRNNLLRVIAALCRQANIELGSGKETTQVRAALELAGFKRPDDKSLRGFLREAGNLARDE